MQVPQTAGNCLLCVLHELQWLKATQFSAKLRKGVLLDMAARVGVKCPKALLCLVKSKWGGPWSSKENGASRIRAIPTMLSGSSCWPNTNTMV